MAVYTQQNGLLVMNLDYPLNIKTYHPDADI